ncbi:hypothetical protein Ciccas_000667 [Cichlidogyrus casuarinus]|uniref:BTB domain-containing protein n=1 Tax=Cichlidogyrus casuarinus TaxID=1844966 RepID=A0ABD2QM98_9PLAT
MHTLRSKPRRVSCSCDLYFVRLKDSSTLFPVEKTLMDEQTDYFLRHNHTDYQLSQLNVINLENVTKEIFQNLLHCLQKQCFPVEDFEQDERDLIKALFKVFQVAENLSIQSVCIMLERYLQSLLSRNNCIQIWRSSHNGSLYLSQLSTQAFANIIWNFTYQIHFHRSAVLDLSPIELLAILKSPYLCLLGKSCASSH